MNKTIRDLFQKAGGTVEVCDVTRDEVLTYSENCDPEVFAKLIIEECISHCGGLDDLDAYTLRKHFGVE